MRWVVHWWRQTDHYDWISGYLLARKMRALTRAIMALVAGSFGVIPLLLLISPADTIRVC